MKVLHLLDTLNRGGAEIQVLDVCRNAADFGIDLTIATFQGGAMEADFIKSGAPFPKERMAKYNRLLVIEKELWAH